MRTASSRTPTLAGVTCHPFCRRASAVFGFRFRQPNRFCIILPTINGLRLSLPLYGEQAGAICNTNFIGTRHQAGELPGHLIVGTRDTPFEVAISLE
jgi:hypothetical protein